MDTLLFRRVVLGVGLLFSIAPSVLAQESLAIVSVNPTGAPFLVDGIRYSAPTPFLWPKGSKHTLEIVAECVGPGAEPASSGCNTRYLPGGWSVNGTAVESPAIITADPAVKEYKGSATVQYRVRVSFFDGNGDTGAPLNIPQSRCIGPKPSNGASGLACVGGQCFRENVSLWLPAGDYPLLATPYDGFAFTGWFTGVSPAPFVSSYRVTGPAVIIPRFEPAKRVRIVTEPPELRVLVDRNEATTSDPQQYASMCGVPGVFDFAEGSTHVLGAPSPQLGRDGKEYIFDSWSSGGGQNTLYRADNANIPETLTAKFIPGIRISFLLPSGLKLLVDGRDSWPSYNFIWGVGTKHTVTAPAEQTDQNGRKWVFKGWSNGGPATQTFILDTSSPGGTRLTAEYAMLGMVILQSSFPVTLQVGDQTCDTPCTLHRDAGTELTITAPRTIPQSEGTRLELQSFLGGTTSGDTTGIRTVRFGTEPIVLAANYKPAYRVFVSSDPANGADFRMEPASLDGFYPANTRVLVYSTSRLGYKFKRWEGDATDQRFSPASVVVSGPLRLRAVLETTPEISKAGVKNGAGETPVNGVAPGSIISIYGGNLASGTELGTGQPLQQTLSGVTVTVAGRILPLYFVSPEQINAQLPYDLPISNWVLTVRNRSLPDVSTTFEVVRNAPGLLVTPQDGRSLATITRINGPAVNSANPIKAGELINIFGTGFGPHRVSPPEGFGVDEADGYRLVDSVEVIVGDQTVIPEYAGVAAGLPGVIVLRVRMPAALSAQAITILRTVVNGISSNEVVLPTASAYATVSADESPL